MDDLKLIKKHYGEDMAHLCRELFPSLLETKGLLFKLLKDNFQYSKFLCEDILEYDLKNAFQEYVYDLSKMTEQVDEFRDVKNPYDLMKEAGYALYKCKTDEDIQKFRKYYIEDEELCTFRDQRLRTCDVFFAVKDNVDEIKREDFKNPKREDEYGTSVISIQFRKGNHYLSIKNRYNHTVNNPDATFGNNLDNIVPGLTESFKKHLNYNIKKESNTVESEFVEELTSYYYVQDKNDKFYHCYYEVECDNRPVYFCSDNVIIRDGEVVREYLDKNRYLVFDTYILDLHTQKILTKADGAIVSDLDDSFYEVINNINFDKLEILKTKDGNKDIIFSKDDKRIIITIDGLNRMIKYYDEISEYLPDRFFGNSVYLSKIELENVIEIGSSFYGYCSESVEISAPKLRKVKNSFMNSCTVKKVYFPLLEEVGCRFCDHYGEKEISLPSLKFVGSRFLAYSYDLERVDFPNLEEADGNFLERAHLSSIYLPKMNKLDELYSFWNAKFKEFIAPSLHELPVHFENDSDIANNLETIVIGNNNPKYLLSLYRKFPNLKSINGIDIENIFNLALKEQHKKTKTRRLNQ